MFTSESLVRNAWIGVLLGCGIGLQPAPDAAPPEPGDRPAAVPEPSRDRDPGARQARERRRAVQVPDNVELVRDVVYATVEGAKSQPIELRMDTAFLRQSDGSPMPVVVYIHGGGWSGGSKNAGLPMAVAFAQGGYFAATIEYRLSSTDPFPNAIHDCKAAIRFLRTHAAELGIDADRIGVWGHSAGGHLSAMLGASGNDPSSEGSVGATGVSSAVRCVATVSGPSDLIALKGGDPGESPDGERNARNELRRGPLSGYAETLKQASPVHFIDSGDPPFLIVHGTRDELVPVEQADLLKHAIDRANGSVDIMLIADAGHTVNQPEALTRIAVFFDQHLGGSAESHVTSAAERQQRVRGERGRGRSAGEDAPPAAPAPEI
jgi:acetyl esterase/lipase